MDAPLADSDPLLAEVVAEPTHYAGGLPNRPWTYVEWDQAFRPDDTEGGFNRYGWNATDQAAFETLWPAQGDRWVDELIEDYAAMWPWLITRVVQARAPEVEAGLKRLYAEKVIGQPPPGAWAEAKRHRRGESAFGITINLTEDGELTVSGPSPPDERPRNWATVRNDEYIVVATGLMYGPFDRARSRRTWPDPPIYCCRICGQHQETRHLRSWMLERHGPPRYCQDCNIRIRTGRYVRRKADVTEGVRRLANALERIPGQQVHLEPLHGYTPAKRDEVAAALIVAPDPKHAMKVVKGKWLDVLKAAELVEDGWRSTRGTYCTAADGHACRSLAERSVDDWLSSHGIEHQPEPRYPGSSMRADWLLPGGVYVEYAGLLGDEKYAAKLAEKRGLAEAAGIRLVVLAPEDLQNIGERLGEWTTRL